MEDAVTADFTLEGESGCLTADGATRSWTGKEPSEVVRERLLKTETTCKYP